MYINGDIDLPTIFPSLDIIHYYQACKEVRLDQFVAKIRILIKFLKKCL